MVEGFEMTDCAWRGPIRPPPIMAILRGVEAIVLLWRGDVERGLSRVEKIRYWYPKRGVKNDKTERKGNLTEASEVLAFGLISQHEARVGVKSYEHP